MVYFVSVCLVRKNPDFSGQFMGATIESNSFITRVNKRKIWEAVLDENREILLRSLMKRTI